MLSLTGQGALVVGIAHEVSITGDATRALPAQDARLAAIADTGARVAFPAAPATCNSTEDVHDIDGGFSIIA